jgi:hypothetical protein
VSVRCCRTRRRDAHRTEERKVLYPWHPWEGCLVHVHEVVEKASGEVFRCNREGGSSTCWLELPNWMFDQTSCAAIRLDVVPSVDIGALSALTSLLREVAAYAGSSNARLSGVARASHDQNDAHAMPYEPLSRPSTPAIVETIGSGRIGGIVERHGESAHTHICDFHLKVPLGIRKPGKRRVIMSQGDRFTTCLKRACLGVRAIRRACNTNRSRHDLQACSSRRETLASPR